MRVNRRKRRSPDQIIVQLREADAMLSAGQAIVAWMGHAKVGTLYIEPGSPWQNGYAESFHSRVRDELLESELFTCLAEAKMLSTQWGLEYNHRRPHSSLGYVAPARGNTLIASGTGIGGRSRARREPVISGPCLAVGKRIRAPPTRWR